MTWATDLAPVLRPLAEKHGKLLIGAVAWVATISILADVWLKSQEKSRVIAAQNDAMISLGTYAAELPMGPMPE